ncbi:VOC family protein [Sphingomonas sp. AOB5]|uniref:VOC family protein n=1 Tax=Sphingomonas sp. AOB5 TaxID=3034017 RepID=UPI0023F92463|nr:VOC family protein [Sphingomonas sp. AOB5]MDF7776460.1 VOC family protein [Sphingomonas sp. AOB5]
MATIDHPLRATLYELGLHSEQPERLAAFYTSALGYAFDGKMLGVARDRRVSIAAGPSKTLAYAAYAVPDAGDLDALEARLIAAGTAFERIDTDGFEPGAVAFADPDGNRFRFGIASGGAARVFEGTADRAARIQHVVFATTDIDRLLGFFIDVIGFALSDVVVDGEGVLKTGFVRCSHEHHSLAVFAAKENRLDHHCYEAVDWNLIRDWADHFAKLRIPLKWGPGRHGPGDNLFVFIHDPDGNWLEISAELEHVAPDRPVGEWPHEEYTLNSWGIGLLRS